jgi:uncharacterized protein involved in type VI secretion and phage assembly
MHQMVQTIRRIARHEVEQHHHPCLAVVKSVHGRNGASDYSCTVTLRETGLVLPKVPIATGVIGMTALPREDDLVVVLFLGGDLHAPVVVGRLYSEGFAPPMHGPGEVVGVLPGGEESSDKALELRIKTPDDGTRSMKLTLDGSVKVEVEVNDEGVRVQAQDAQVLVKQTGSSDGQVLLKVGNSSVTVEQGGDITITAEGKLTLKGKQVEVSGDTSIKIAGQTIDLN